MAISETGTGRAPAGTTQSFPTALSGTQDAAERHTGPTHTHLPRLLPPRDWCSLALCPARGAPASAPAGSPPRPPAPPLHPLPHPSVCELTNRVERYDSFRGRSICEPNSRNLSLSRSVFDHPSAESVTFELSSRAVAPPLENNTSLASSKPEGPFFSSLLLRGWRAQVSSSHSPPCETLGRPALAPP
jgi:hypothetical protein